MVVVVVTAATATPRSTGGLTQPLHAGPPAPSARRRLEPRPPPRSPQPPPPPGPAAEERAGHAHAHAPPAYGGGGGGDVNARRARSRGGGGGGSPVPPSWEGRRVGGTHAQEGRWEKGTAPLAAGRRWGVACGGGMGCIGVTWG